jgi:hypothetical protein
LAAAGTGSLFRSQRGDVTTMNIDSRIADFWRWFVDWHLDVAEAYAADDMHWLAANLTERVQRIEPRLNWEIGPYRHPDNTLVISPSVRDNIELARNIAAAAPELPGWHILPAKPPKELTSLAMELPGSPGAVICGDDWSYQLVGYDRMSFFDIEVFTDVSALDGAVSDRDLRLLTHRLIESLVGEVLYLERIADVTIQRSGVHPAKKTTSLGLLGKHLRHLVGDR